jgi:hypothetical protein
LFLISQIAWNPNENKRLVKSEFIFVRFAGKNSAQDLTQIEKPRRFFPITLWARLTIFQEFVFDTATLGDGHVIIHFHCLWQICTPSTTAYFFLQLNKLFVEAQPLDLLKMIENCISSFLIHLFPVSLPQLTFFFIQEVLETRRKTATGVAR